MDQIVIQIGTGVLVAAVYGGYAYLTKKLPDPSGTEFDVEKFVGTVLIGGVVGGVMGYYGMAVTETAVVATLISIGAIEVTQKFLKPIFNWIREKLGY